jgi:signal transduction histidine kinase
VSVRARAVRSLTGARSNAQDGEQAGAQGEEQPGGAPRPAGDRVIVRVVDRGPGIPPAQLERVFEPFYRAGRPGGENRGSGLGLAIARGFTEANAGSLRVESLPGQGAAFVFELPLRAFAAPHEGDPAALHAGEAAPPSRSDQAAPAG